MENEYGQFGFYAPARQVTLRQYTAKTFLMMFFGLLITFGTAWFVSQTVAGLSLLLLVATAIPAIHIVLLVAQLVVVIAMTAFVHKLSPAAAAACFVVYSFLTGLTFTCFFLIYDLRSLVLVFAFAALYFGGMALFGYFTSIDLSRIRTLLLGGLITLVVINVLMMFIPRLSFLDHILCTVGVVIFMGYTAFDTQKLKAYYYSFQGDDAMLKKTSIISALVLYLDFVNLFLYLLRLFGRQKK